VLLIIRRSWVRAPPAPPAVLIPVVGEPWTGLYTDVGGAIFEPSGRIRSHRATLERLLARQGVRRNRLPGNYAHATPDTLQRRFLDTPVEISSTSTDITVKINRRAYSPVLRGADLPDDTTVPWWDGRQLHFEFA
jgi:hypothetical protein